MYHVNKQYIAIQACIFASVTTEEEIELLNDCELTPIRSDFVHLAGGGMDADATRFIDSRIKKLLDN